MRTQAAMIHSMNDRLEPSQLYQRVRMLFGVERAPTASHPPGADSPYAVNGDIRAFEVPIPQAECTAENLTDAWLSTPNPQFGDHCPQEFLNGSQDQRAFLESILSSFEDGAFS